MTQCRRRGQRRGQRRCQHNWRSHCQRYGRRCGRCHPIEFARMFALPAMIPLLVLALLAGTLSSASAQTDSSAPVNVGVTVPAVVGAGITDGPVPDPTEEPPPATDVPVPTTESLPTETPVDPEPTATDTPIDPEPSILPPTELEMPTPAVVASETPVPSAAATDVASPAPSPSPTATLQASLSYTLDNAIRCQPSTSVTEVRHGSSIDYRCSLALLMEGEGLAVGSVRIDWQVKADVDEGWTVQLRNQGAEWQAAASGAVVTSTEEFATSTLKDGGSGAHGLSVDLRISRNRCVADGGNVALIGGAIVSLPDAPDAVINIPARSSASADVAPGLVAIPKPDVTFSGTLQLGTVVLGPTRNATSTSGAIALEVTGLDQSCGSWNIVLHGEALSGESGSMIDAGHLRLVAVNGEPVDSGRCDLTSGCVVEVARFEPGVAATTTYELQFELDIPAGTTAGPFASIWASVEAP